ncbi:MAG: hypothetical protein GX491_22175 [Chloroflexi bacterium]|nr:hypothetical protein [Chloroflexota bacterium]
MDDRNAAQQRSEIAQRQQQGSDLPSSDAALQTADSRPSFPDQVIIFPLLFWDAIHARLGGAIRVWALARALDATGCGGVLADDLNAYLDALNVHPRSRRRWINDAVKCGLLTPFYRTRSGLHGYRYAAGYRAAIIVGCQSVGTRPVKVSAVGLVSAGWHSLVWAAFTASTGERPITRKCKQLLTGVSKQTQLNLEAQQPIQVTPNYVITRMPADRLTGVREFQKAHAFVFTKPNRKQVIAWRGPNSYKVPSEVAATLPKTRCNVIKKRLSRAGHTTWQKVVPARSNDDALSTGRLYFDSEKGANRRIRKLTRPQAPPTRVRELFIALPRHGLLPPSSQSQIRFWRQESIR